MPHIQILLSHLICYQFKLRESLELTGNKMNIELCLFIIVQYQRGRGGGGLVIIVKGFPRK